MNSIQADMNMCNSSGFMGETAKEAGAELLNWGERGGKSSSNRFQVYKSSAKLPHLGNFYSCV